MSQENVEVVRRMVDAFNGGDVEAVIAAFDEGCELHEPLEMPDTPTEGFRGRGHPRVDGEPVRDRRQSVRADELHDQRRVADRIRIAAGRPN